MDEWLTGRRREGGRTEQSERDRGCYNEIIERIQKEDSTMAYMKRRETETECTEGRESRHEEEEEGMLQDPQ